jgi:hypothetical protein
MALVVEHQYSYNGSREQEQIGELCLLLSDLILRRSFHRNQKILRFLCFLLFKLFFPWSSLLRYESPEQNRSRDGR